MGYLLVQSMDDGFSIGGGKIFNLFWILLQ
jgi:hypothetical protein